MFRTCLYFEVLVQVTVVEMVDYLKENVMLVMTSTRGTAEGI